MAMQGTSWSKELAEKMYKRLDKQGEEHPTAPRQTRSIVPQTSVQMQGEKGGSNIRKLKEELERVKKERDDALTQIRVLQEQVCRENAQRNFEIFSFREDNTEVKKKNAALEEQVQGLHRSNTDLMRRQTSLEEARTEIQLELTKSLTQIRRLEADVQIAKEEMEKMNADALRMRSQLSEVIKTKVDLELELSAARGRESELRHEIEEQMEKCRQLPRSCQQFKMTEESDDEAEAKEYQGYDLEFVHEDATDLSQHFSIARVASIGRGVQKRAKAPRDFEWKDEEIDFPAMLAELQDALKEAQEMQERDEKAAKMKAWQERLAADPTPLPTPEECNAIIEEMERSMQRDREAAQKLSESIPENQGSTAAASTAQPSQPSSPTVEPPTVLSGFAMLSPYSSFHKYANSSLGSRR